MKPTLALRSTLFRRALPTAIVAFCFLCPNVHAANIWDGGAGTGSTTTTTNWDNNLVPTSGTLTFAGSVQTTIVWNGINSVSPVNLSGFTFGSGASAFTINAGTQNNVQFVTGGTPLLNSSSNLQTLNILSSVFFNGVKTFDGGASGAGFALNGGIDLRWDSLGSGQTNTLNLIGTADSTTAFISQTGTQTSGALNAVTKNGTGKWTVTGNATYTGATTITQGTLEFQGSVSSSSIANSGALIFNNAATQSYANNISGGGSVTKQGAGTLTISGAKTYTGATTITGGTLSVASIANGGSASGIGQSTAVASNLVFDGGALQYSGGTSASNRAFTINSGKTATIEVTNGASNLSLIGATGAATDGALTKTGAGTLTLSGANTYTGATTVSQGTLKMGYSGSTSVTLTNASFETDAGTTNNFQYRDITGWTNVGAGSSKGIEQGTSTTFSGVSGVTGLPNYNATTNFKWAFVQGAQTMSQTVTVATDGFYNVGFAASGRSGINGPLNIQVLVDGVNQTSGTTITPAQGGWNTYTSNGVFLAAGSHTLAFSFINALGGDRSSTLDQVSLTGATQGSLAAATTLSIASGATFDINGTSQTVASLSDSGGGGGSVINSNSVLSSVITVGSASGSTTFSGAIGGGTLGFTKTGASTQILSGTNTYTGATLVSGGTLAVDGSLANTSGVTVQTGATLQGSGSITSSVTIQGNGILATGNSIESLGTGTLTFDANSTLAYQLNNDAASGVAGDLTFISGDLNLALTNNAILTLTELGTGSWTIGDKLTLLSYSGTWNTGLFDYFGTDITDESQLVFSGATWLFNYNDTAEGTNYTSDSIGNYVTMTVIPEPSSALLSAIGLLFLLRRRR